MDQVHPGCPNRGWGGGCGWLPSARALSEVSSTILLIPLFALSPVFVPLNGARWRRQHHTVTRHDHGALQDDGGATNKLQTIAARSAALHGTKGTG